MTGTIDFAFRRDLLSGRRALVTGASRGIGRAIARHLALAGAQVFVVARQEAGVARAIADLTAEGLAVDGLAIDLREASSGTRVLDAARARLGALDILVNNAGATRRGDFLDLDEDAWADGFALKFHAARRLARAFWPDLASRHGAILNIVGTGGRTPGAEFAIGGSVNAALLSLTKALAERGIADRVQVNAINPGPVRTDRFETRLSHMMSADGLDRDAALAAMTTALGVTRIGVVDDIAALATFVVSPAGRLLQGALIDMDGGATKTI